MKQEQMRSFLLGTMPDAARRVFEEEFFESEEIYEQLQDSLNDLIDDYARGDLDGEERRRVEERLLESPRNRAKLELARALAQRELAPAHQLRPAIPLWLRVLASAAGIAAMAWLGFDDVRVRRELHARPAVETGSDSPQIATVRLSPRLLRGAAAAPQVTLPSGGNFVRVELSTGEVYSSYSVEIETTDRGRIWTQTALSRTGGAVGLWLPASLMAPGNYEFLLYGTSGGASELLGSYPCRVLAESPISTNPAQ